MRLVAGTVLLAMIQANVAHALPLLRIDATRAVTHFAMQTFATSLPEDELGDESEALMALRQLEARLLEEHNTGAPSIIEQRPEWLREGWELPSIPAAWTANVGEFVRFFTEDRRGRAIYAAWHRRMEIYGPSIRATLREDNLPEDLAFVSMIESGFTPTARSGVGAVGLWQFMPSTGDAYGLRRSHWLDERMHPEKSTHAAAQFLGDLHTRLGSWELALAAYNMGYGATMRSIEKYNTNDFWALVRHEAGLPYETTLYVAKILACAVIGKNAERANFPAPPASEAFANVDVPGAIPLTALARAARVEAADLRRWNPHLLRTFTAPDFETVSLRLPVSAAANLRTQLERTVREHKQPTHRVRFGERLDDIASRYRTQAAVLARTNEVPQTTRVTPDTTLILPRGSVARATADEDLVVSVPANVRAEAARQRVFYRVADGDTIGDVARFFRVSGEELRRWNELDLRAALQPGMFVQLYLPQSFDTSRALVYSESDVRVLVTGSDEFFAYHEARRGRVRTTHTVTAGDTLETLARRYDLSVGSLCRINRLNARTRLEVGQSIIVYAPQASVPAIEAPSVTTPETPASEASEATAATTSREEPAAQELAPEPAPEEPALREEPPATPEAVEPAAPAEPTPPTESPAPPADEPPATPEPPRGIDWSVPE